MTLEQLLSKRLLVLLGKGGVGKTALAGALGLLAARQGARVLIMECDSRAPLARSFGHQARYAPTEVAPGLSIMTLDGAHALEEYLGMVVPGRAIMRAVTASPLYQFFAQAAPGLRELMMLGKVLYEVERKPSDPNHHSLVIVDAPASGQALAMLRMPAAARATFGDAIVGREARNIVRLLHDRKRTALLEVTTSDSLALSETLEVLDALRSMELAPGAILFNRVPEVTFNAKEVANFLADAPAVSRSEAEHLAEVARRELAAHSRAARAVDRLRERDNVDVLVIPEQRGMAGTQLVEQLASKLALRLPDFRESLESAPARN